MPALVIHILPPKEASSDISTSTGFLCNRESEDVSISGKKLEFEQLVFRPLQMYCTVGLSIQSRSGATCILRIVVIQYSQINTGLSSQF